jgi:hypothetical protein
MGGKLGRKVDASHRSQEALLKVGPYDDQVPISLLAQYQVVGRRDNLRLVSLAVMGTGRIFVNHSYVGLLLHENCVDDLPLAEAMKVLKR